MSMKKNLMIAAAVATIGAGSIGVGLASAATNNSTSGGSSLVDKLVAKFGLKKADVQAVFDAEHTTRQAERTQAVADKLAAAVKAGTITQTQSDAITAKLKAMQAERETGHAKFESMTDAERKTAVEAKKAEMKKWLSDNKIPEDFMRTLHMGGHHGGMMGADHDKN
jgi:hypothetical protein